MVKGVSRQVIVLHSPDPELFEQAIFILKDGSKGFSDEALMKEAKMLLRAQDKQRKAMNWLTCSLWALGGASVTGLIWAILWLL